MILANFEIEKLLAAITGAGGAIVLAALWIRHLIAQVDGLVATGGVGRGPWGSRRGSCE